MEKDVSEFVMEPEKERAIQGTVEVLREFGYTEDEVEILVANKYNISGKKAREYM
ncbi:hypothetical protein LJC58_04615 [Lachnospiraceae bacterium OttesenSCG-928-D06]|nr:hypothetical protein [Lachnospiraceae bacterium OttesenSCG-928-D06]